MQRRAFVASTLGLPLAGCLVMPYGTYYRPSSADPGARVRRAWCGGQAGPSSVLELDLPGDVALVARTGLDGLERPRADLPLRVELTLPAAQPVQFLGATAEVRESSGGQRIAARLSARAHGSATLGAGDTVDPKALRPAGAAAQPGDAQAPHGRARWTFTAPPDFAPPSLTLQLPDVLSGTEALATPPVLLSRPASTQRPGDYRSAAEQQHLRDREAACRRDTPQLSCENIVPLSERSFELTAGPLQWSGRWSRYEGGTVRSPLRGEQTLVVRDARPWRLRAGAVTLADTAGSGRVTVPAATVDFSIVDSVELDTPLHGVASAARGATRLVLELSLPPSPPSFELRLPALQIGARRVDLAPFRFERRSFDGGIEPFNC